MTRTTYTLRTKAMENYTTKSKSIEDIANKAYRIGAKNLVDLYITKTKGFINKVIITMDLPLPTEDETRKDYVARVIEAVAQM